MVSILAGQKLVHYLAQFHEVNKFFDSLFNRYIQHFLSARNHSKTSQILAHFSFTTYTLLSPLHRRNLRNWQVNLLKVSEIELVASLETNPVRLTLEAMLAFILPSKNAIQQMRKKIALKMIMNKKLGYILFLFLFSLKDL